ncbi:MAG: hypothetical protein JWM19_731 [Actinomycetia bacterium]|nr:hypothetical protein [Actinomycetes bacterium]
MRQPTRALAPCLDAKVHARRDLGVALIIAFGYAFTWVYAAIGLAVRDPQTAQMASILPMFILFFASSAPTSMEARELVPASLMPLTGDAA